MGQLYVVCSTAFFLVWSFSPLPHLQRPTPSPGSRHFEKVFPAGENATLILENTSVYGNVELKAWNQPLIKVVAEILSPHILVEATPTDRSVHVRLRRQGLVSVDSVHFHVWLPPHCEVELSSLSGKITVRGLRARLKASTTDGDIELIDISGESIDAISSTRGNITLIGPLDHEGKYNLYSGSGQVRVIFPATASFTLDAATREGRIDVEGFQLTEEHRSPHHLEGTYGEGVAVLMIRTYKGIIHLQKQ